jgi:predicted nucleotidyltransferase
LSLLSVERALGIAKEFALDISHVSGNSLIAIYAIGSLGGGYYRPGQSDIDTLIIFDDTAEYYKSEIGKVAANYQIKYNIPKGFGAVIANKKQLFPPYNKADELILEIINLKKQGVLLFGNFNVDSVPMPDRKAVIEDANAFEDWRDSKLSNCKPLLTLTECVNSILILLKRYLLIEKDIIEFNKFRVVKTYLDNNPPKINNEIFEIINNYIMMDQETKVTELELEKMNQFHEELKTFMNSLLLSR